MADIIQAIQTRKWCHVIPYMVYIFLWAMVWLPLLILLVAPWWRHQMKTFSALLAICAGNSPVSVEFAAQRPVKTGEFPEQRPVTRSFDVFFDLHLNKRAWVNNHEAGDLRHYRAHYDVTVNTHTRLKEEIVRRVFCWILCSFKHSYLLLSRFDWW